MGIDKDSVKGNQFPAWHWLALPIVLLLIQSLFLASGSDRLAYSEFKQLLKAGNVDEVRIGDDAITGTLKPEGLERILSPKKLDMLKRTDNNRRAFSTGKSRIRGRLALFLSTSSMPSARRAD
jgi:cell division protease FtsH